jgi:hypothetical protein
MPGAGRRGGRPAGAVASVAVLAGIGLSACGGSGAGQALAQQACVHVNRSVTDWVRAADAGTPAASAAQLRDQADQQLRAALPLAAAANSDDGTWNALMTTISEGATVDEGHLVPALRAQCAVADTNPNVNPQGPGSGSSGGTGSQTGNSGNSGNSEGGSRTTVPQNVNPAPASPAG